MLTEGGRLPIQSRTQTERGTDKNKQCEWAGSRYGRHTGVRLKEKSSRGVSLWRPTRKARTSLKEKRALKKENSSEEGGKKRGPRTATQKGEAGTINNEKR